MTNAWISTALRRALGALTTGLLLAGCSSGTPGLGGAPGPSPGQGEQVGAGGRPVRPAAEPGEAPAPARPPAGQVIALPPGAGPWGVAADPVTGLVLVALRNPARYAVYNTKSRSLSVQPAPGVARMIDLVRPGGPLLFPAENRDTLFTVALPSLRILSQTPAGRSPHQAVAAGDTVFVTDEFGHEVRALRDGQTVAEFHGPVQPGGITAAEGRVAAVDVATATLFVYDAATLRPVAALPAGQGPSHVVPIGGSRVAVCDVRGNAVLTYELAGTPRQLGRVAVPGRAFWIEADPATNTVYTALSNTNLIAALQVQPDGSLRLVATVPTVRQPNSMDLDATTGTVYVAGFADSQLEVIPASAFTSQ